MAPKSALLTTGTDDLQKESAPRYPMTTMEKRVAAAAKKNIFQGTSLESPQQIAKPKPKPRPKSFPPPGEALPFRITKPSSAVKKSTRLAKVMTTKEKRSVSQAAKKAKSGVQPKKQEKAKGRGGAKGKKTTGPSFMSVLASHDPSTYHEWFKSQEPSVLVRPTGKARWFQQRSAVVLNQAPSEAAKESTSGVFRIMDLPKNVRAEIWKLSVVYPDFLVCPDLPTGREQPDLAMVSRNVRKEVLPIYYRHNVFGVQLEDQNPKSKSLTGLAAIAKWSKRLEERGRFGMIRKWAFNYAATPLKIMHSLTNDEEDDSLIVAVTFVKCADQSWTVDTGAVQVHHDAQCILPGCPEYDKCIIRTSPKWLHDLVCNVTSAARGREISGSMILDLAKGIKEGAEKLVDVRCDKTTIYST